LKDNARLRTVAGEDFVRLIHETPAGELLPALENPSLNEELLCLVLQRKDLPPELLQEVIVRRHFLKSYRVKKALAFHPHTPRAEGSRLLRELYLMDLVQFAASPGVLPDMKIKAEAQVIAKLPQLALGQKITLARKAPARITGALLAEGNPPVVKAALANPNLTEAQVLRVLSRDKLPAIVAQSIAQDSKWGHVYNVRMALVRQPAMTLAAVLRFLPELAISDLRELAAPGILPDHLRRYLEAEIARRREQPNKEASLATVDRGNVGEPDALRGDDRGRGSGSAEDK
jgi:hypothetical protein